MCIRDRPITSPELLPSGERWIHELSRPTRLLGVVSSASARRTGWFRGVLGPGPPSSIPTGVVASRTEAADLEEEPSAELGVGGTGVSTACSPTCAVVGRGGLGTGVGAAGGAPSRSLS
eukprot:8311693-Alexandrium_andersonii.AAC.1